jgi:polyhydroxyalkanoate synthase subunit PhaC
MDSALQIQWSGLVEQTVHGDETVELHKEIVVLDDGEDLPLALVRKHLPGGPTRPAVLLVHGFAQNRYTWHISGRSMSAWLAAQGFDTWNLELRGHGRSREVAADRATGAEVFDDYVGDVLRAADALPGPAFWIGHSLGGAALYGAATQAEGEARPLGVVGIGALFRFGQANPFLKLLGGLTHQLRDRPWLPRIQVRSRLAGRLLGKLYGVSDVAGWAFPISGWWPGSMEPDLLAERLEKGFDWTSVRVWQEMSRWAAEDRFEYEEAWADTDLPLLVTLGDKDHLMPPADGRSAYDRSGSSDKELVVFDDWHHETHWGHLDLVLGKRAPDHVWPTIGDWMAARS